VPTPSATNSIIVIEPTKGLLGKLLLGPQGVLAKTFAFEELVPIFDKCKYMSSPNIWNDVITFWYLRKI
jgi:hypothetical protein